MKTWAIGDVHACGHTLRALVEKLGPCSGDCLIFLGDLIDRGKSMPLVLESIEELLAKGVQVRLLRGNHEDAFIQALEEGNNPPKRKLFQKRTLPALNTWKSFGGNEVLRSFGANRPEELPEILKNLINDSEFWLEHEKFYLVHAGFNFKHEPFWEDTQSMMWLREFDVDLKKTGGRRVVHGHIPVSLDLIKQSLEQPNFGFIDLDNGCVYRDRPGMGNLVALELQNEKLTVQPNIEPYQ
jgi:serine/threonine protein phosphatase 1